MRSLLVFLLVLSVMLIAVPAAAQHYIFDYYGFSQEGGATLNAVGFLDQIMPPLTSDLASYQYTYAWENITIDAIVPMGPYVRYYYVGGTFRVYEDASFNAWYDDSNCPTSTLISLPSTFTDGDLYLEAVVDTIVHQFNTTTGIGSITGSLEYVGGSHLVEIPLDAREGTTYGGTTNNPLACVPDGYDYRWDCQAYYIEHPIGAEDDTWGSVKSLFR